MKYTFAAVMLLSLAGAFAMAMLAMAHICTGEGLHPALAAIGAIALLFAGYLAATTLEKDHA